MCATLSVAFIQQFKDAPLNVPAIQMHVPATGKTHSKDVVQRRQELLALFWAAVERDVHGPDTRIVEGGDSGEDALGNSYDGVLHLSNYFCNSCKFPSNPGTNTKSMVLVGNMSMIFIVFFRIRNDFRLYGSYFFNT